MKPALKLAFLATIFCTGLILLLAGCTYKRSITTITTPAVYAVTGGVTNLVSAATVTQTMERERLWLPRGYAAFVESDGYGVDFSVIDPQTGNPGRIRAGVWHSAGRLIPTGTNAINAPAFTSSGSIRNNGLPFSLTGTAQFTSGASQVQQSNNATAGAVVPK